jgi:hypothetical protein
MDLQWPH